MIPVGVKPNPAILEFFLGVSVCAAVAVATPAIADEKKAPKSRTQITLSYAPVVKRVSPAVVNIQTQRMDFAASSPMFRDPFFRRFFGSQKPRAQRPHRSLGSGVIIRPHGMIVTNNHVIRGAAAIKVILAYKREFAANIVLKDKRTDLAILKIDGGGEKFPFLKFGDADGLEIGDLVLAFGNPFGVGQTVTGGIVSALARTEIGITDYRFFIQTDAAINPGNSGGPLITMDGHVVGINTAIYSRSGGSVGIGFAIPSTMVQAVLRVAEKGGKLKRPWLGISGQAVNAEIAKALGLRRVGGVIVREVVAGSPGAKAGLQVNDIIVSINDREVNDIQALRFRLATMELGITVRLAIVRSNKPRILRLVLQGASGIPSRRLTILTGQHPMQGAQVENLSPTHADDLGVQETNGVVVRRIRRRSVSHYNGFRPGDIVLEINGKRIKTVGQLQNALRLRDDHSWHFIVRRGRLLIRRRLSL
ncbi:MAG: Do family serine endopeptidase [Rhodospirillaceae bacterium]|nr:Do family serine endopeptidase [Rhodospirillaceae bacterium]